MKVQPGDYFCVRSESWLAGPILALEKLKAMDGEAKYNHSGIIVSSDGTTFESLRKIAHYGLQGYDGCEIIIARHRDMTPERFRLGYDDVRKWDQYAYPWWRLALHAAGLAKFLHATKIPVCSELVMEHLHHAGLWPKHGYGWNPDQLADAFTKWKCFDVIYEGRLKCTDMSL